MDKPQHQARKRFGQNFLHDPAIIGRIVDIINPQAEDNLIEIGPGQGALTRPLLERTKQLNVIEIDRDLVSLLKEEFAMASDRLHIHEADVLKFDFTTLGLSKLRIVGNLPYNISTPVLFHLLDNAELIQDMLFMLQKEVVDRICASPDSHKYGRLSVMLQYACEVDALMTIKPGAFKPAPKVDSAIVRLIPKKTIDTPVTNFAVFSRLVRDAFSQRRKTIRNALKTYFSNDDFEALDIASDKRPENLSVNNYVTLANHYDSIRDD